MILLSSEMVGKAKAEFDRRLWGEWIPAFCDDPKRQCSAENFRVGEIEISEKDAHDFLRGIDHGVAVADSRHRFRMPRSYYCDAIFLRGKGAQTPRRFFLWVEAVITIAAAARLHLDYGWPVKALGTQSADSAFDLMAFKPPDAVNEHIAAEMKKTSEELRCLIHDMQKCCAGQHDGCASEKQRINAHKKWMALQSRRPSLFWAVGPSAESRAFEVSATADGACILLSEVDETVLFYKA